MFKIEELVKQLGATYNGNLKEVKGLAPFEFAEEGEITFASDEKFLKKINDTKAKILIVPPINDLPKDKEYIYVNKSPRELMPIILNFFKRKTKSFEKQIEDSALIGDNVSIAPGTYIGHDVVIGENTIIYPNVSIMEGVKLGKNVIIYSGVTIREFCEIGDNVILQPGAIIGSDGFGYVKVAGENVKIEQIGIVVIEDNVEVGANTTIDRGTIGNTIIKRGTKIDNLVHIAHNVIVGEQSFLVAQVGIAGSSIIGNNATLGGQVGVVGHVKIGDNVSIGAKGGVTGNVEDNKILSGYPAINHSDDLKIKISMKKLPDLLKRVKKLETLLDKGGDK